MKKAQKILALFLAAILMVMSFAACGNTSEDAASNAADGTAESPLKVVYYVSGQLGDKSFFDSSNRGLERAVSELGIVGKTVEGGYDQSFWEPDLMELAEADWDVIVVGTYEMVEILQRVAVMHPEKKFIIFDAEVDYSIDGMDNVYSVLFKQNDGAFLAGMLAGLITESDLPYATPDKKIGFLGAMDIPVIDDALVGYTQGAKYVDPEIEVLTSYVGSFDDPATGKEMSLAQYNQGVDIIINPASQSGLGVFDAAAEAQRYAIGFDSDQWQLFADTDPEKAGYIVSSMMKNVDATVFRAIELTIKGELQYGATESLGIAEGGVGLADNENFKAIVPAEFVEIIKEAEEKIVSGEIIVDTAL